MANILHTRYPFATSTFYVDGSKTKKNVYYDYFNSLIKFDQKRQFSLEFISQFLDKIEFENNVAVRFFPLAKSKNIVVDPKHQFGQPTIYGTNIKASTIYGYHLGGDKKKDIAQLYDLKTQQVEDAIRFCSQAA